MLESANPQGYSACCVAVRDYDARQELSSISTPTMVIAGGQDSSTPPADGQFIADRIPGARYLELPAAHISNVEASDRFTTEVAGFLSA
jgi:3-oxoadipate enol-lactonase